MLADFKYILKNREKDLTKEEILELKAEKAALRKSNLKEEILDISIDRRKTVDEVYAKVSKMANIHEHRAEKYKEEQLFNNIIDNVIERVAFNKENVALAKIYDLSKHGKSSFSKKVLQQDLIQQCRECTGLFNVLAGNPKNIQKFQEKLIENLKHGVAGHVKSAAESLDIRFQGKKELVLTRSRGNSIAG